VTDAHNNLISRHVTVPKRTLRALVLHLRSPESGVAGQGIRFVLAGGTVFIVYLGTTTVFAEGFGVAFQLALVIGFSVALVLHFLLQRFFVWVHHGEFVLAPHLQLGRYAVVAGLQYGTTAAITFVLPRVLHVPVILVYLITMIVFPTLNFLVFRSRVFHADAESAAPSVGSGHGNQDE
jgi:putative flippase GtrA